MEWWRCDNGFPEHPKHGQLARALGKRRDEAVLIVLRLLCWVARVRENGDLTDTHEDEIADACHWKGRPAALVSALVDVGWLDRIEDDRLVIHGWLDRNGHPLRERDRVRNWRANRAQGDDGTRSRTRTRTRTVRVPERETYERTYVPTPLPPSAADLHPSARRLAREDATRLIDVARSRGDVREVERLTRLIAELNAADAAQETRS